MELIQIHTTTKKNDQAQAIARALVEQGLAACAQISGPILSIYRWKGIIEEEEEWLVTLKTTPGRFEQARRAIEALHPYELPQITATPIPLSSPEYAGWVAQSLAGHE